jgi:hypothetical protein
MKPMVPPEFTVPLLLEHPLFILRPLLISDVVKDYDAVMSSVEHLQGVFGPGSDWPPPDLSFEQDLIDLGWHHKEFQNRHSFAYTMMNPDESRCLGCAYIFPGDGGEHDAVAYCWVRASDHAALGSILFDEFRAWLAASWPFRSVAFPGRDPA